MIKYQNDCCDCAAPAYPCLGDTCTLRHAPHYYCDETKLFYFDGEQLCIDCIENLLDEVI